MGRRDLPTTVYMASPGLYRIKIRISPINGSHRFWLEWPLISAKFQETSFIWPVRFALAEPSFTWQVVPPPVYRQLESAPGAILAQNKEKDRSNEEQASSSGP